ncbi:transcriptional regulator GcvA [Rhodovibrio salinarum]|uniref:Transcriptional regulator GcvA n=1 Tax=Rhodovibrio salinarum TaxID=1087 RepID=A0A934QKU5_9PROT|nr:transcriptional regulator GcvA [Rhodovibrio salinarum]MBK1698420.1 transcriptional regulator GcvA [Rhodovibrio salinarum]
MARRLPPLNAAKAFEAAARHLSFTRAADELAVTQTAVSHQVRALEDWLGVALFHRGNRRITLTEAGQAYLPGLRDGLDRIAASTAAVADRTRQGPVHISALQSLTSRWLLPRLPDFHAQHPALDVLLSAGDRPVDLYREDFHLALRFTTRDRVEAQGLVATHLMDEAIFPVCAPVLTEAEPPLRTPGDLRGHVLLHDKVDDTPEDPGWAVWCRAAGIARPASPARHYSDAGLVLQAATAGQGVALARLSLVREDLESARLVRPFGPVTRTRYSYYAVTTPAMAPQPRVRTMVDWLVEQARDQADDPLLAEAVPPPEG